MIHGETQFKPIDNKEPKILFGRNDLSVFYRNCMDAFFRLKMYQFGELIETDDEFQVVVHGVFRFSRNKTSNLITFHSLNLRTSEWQQGDVSTSFRIQLLPMLKANSNMWSVQIKNLLWDYVYNQFGYDGIEVVRDKIIKTSDSPKTMGRSRLGVYIVDNILRKMDHKASANAFKKMRHLFHAYIIDKELLRAVMAIDFRNLSVAEYIRYHNQKKAVLRIYKERPNLMPLLLIIKEDYFSHTDLFAEKNWVDKAVPQQINTAPNHGNTLLEFGGNTGAFFDKTPYIKDPTAFRWVLGAPNTVIYALVKSDYIGLATAIERSRFVGILARASQNLKNKVPTLVIKHIINHNYAIRNFELEDRYIRILHIYLNHIGLMWKEHGYNHTKAYIRSSNELHIIVDWFIDEGHQSHPNKNSTWDGLLRHAERWHMEISNRKVKNNLTWDVPFTKTLINGIQINSLNDSISMHQEGVEMHHCVYTYSESCHSHRYRVFSMTDETGHRSTLGCTLNGQIYEMHQHYGSCNSAIKESHRLVADKLIHTLNTNPFLLTHTA